MLTHLLGHRCTSHRMPHRWQQSSQHRQAGCTAPLLRAALQRLWRRSCLRLRPGWTAAALQRPASPSMLLQMMPACQRCFACQEHKPSDIRRVISPSHSNIHGVLSCSHASLSMLLFFIGIHQVSSLTVWQSVPSVYCPYSSKPASRDLQHPSYPSRTAQLPLSNARRLGIFF